MLQPAVFGHWFLFENNGDADTGILEYITAFDSDYSAALDACELSLLTGQGRCTGEIELYYVAGSKRCCYRQPEKNACVADI